jgi:hypothetical protein
MTTKPMGLLLAGFDFSPVAEDEFHDWYDLEHVPERERVPGFGRIERWIGAENPKISIATYDLDTPDILKSEAYRRIAGPNLSVWSKRLTGKAKRVARFQAEQLPPGDREAPDGAGGMLMYAMNFAPEAEAELNAWYDEEHIPRLAAVPGCLMARRYRITSALSDGMQRYLALYHLTSPDVCSSEAWKKAANTQWTERVRPHFRDPLRIPLRKYRRVVG